MGTISPLDQIAALFPEFRAEQFGLVADGDDGWRLIVNYDGDLLVGLYADADSDEQTDGVIIPGDAEPVEVVNTIRQYLTALKGNELMTTHTLESLALDPESTLTILGGDWVATCSCHNPDGEGDGRADFRGDDAYLAYLAWAEHAAKQPDLLIAETDHDKDAYPYARRVKSSDGSVDARLTRYLPTGEVVLSIHAALDGGSMAAHIYLTDEQWNILRGVTR